MFTHRFHRRAAFTLLEVTLVVVIIFLLIIALIPAFRGKRAAQRYPLLPAATPATPQAITTPTVMDLKKKMTPVPKAPPEPQ